MARKLSRRAGYVLLFAATSVALISPRALAENEARATTPANVIENPFATKRSEAKVAAEEPQVPARKSTPYKNPFANTPQSQPIDPSLMPGPVSRWQRPAIPHEEPSAIKSAMLLPRPKAKEPTWDQLPPADRLRQKAFAQNGMMSDPTLFNNLAKTDSTIRFTPQPLGQPASIIEAELLEALPAAAPAIFPEPLSAIAIAGPPVIATPPEPTLTPTGRISNAFDINAAAATEPVQLEEEVPLEIISDFEDTPEAWLEQAQQVAADAQAEDELSNVIDLCNRGIRGIPPAEMLTSLRKLAAWAHNRRGELSADAQRADDAIHDFQVAISLDPTCSLAIHNRAVSLAQRNQYAAALRDFNRVIELNPGLAVAYRNRAELQSALGRMEDAVADYTRTLESLPDDATLFLARAHAYQRLGDFTRAAADISRAIQLAPESPDAYTQRGNLAAEQGKYEQALRDLQWAIEIDANWTEAHRSLAWLQATCTDQKIRNAEASLAAAQRAAELSPADDYLILDTLAAAHACAGKFDEAVRFQEKAIGAAPRDASTALEQRMALYQQNRAYLSRPADSGVRTVSHESSDPPPRPSSLSPPSTLSPPSSPSPPGPRPSPRTAPR